MENDIIIETRDLGKDYIDGGNVIHALNRANIKVRREKWWHNGALRVRQVHSVYILGLLQPPTSGEYIFKGQNILDYEPRRAGPLQEQGTWVCVPELRSFGQLHRF